MKSLKKVAVLLLLALAANAALGAATTYNWNTNAGGNWSATANWSPSTGDPLRDNLDTAIFGNNGGLLSGPSIAVTNDADLQGGVAVYFTNNINYTINPNGYKIKFSSSTTSPIIMSSGTGTNTINSPVVLYGSSLFGITNNSAGLLTLNQIQTAVSVAHPTNVFLFGGTGNILWASNVITAGGNVCTNSLTMGGSGTLTLAADPTTNLNNGITVSAGTLVMKGQTNVTVTSSHTGGTTINSGAVLELGDGTAGGGFGDPGTSGLTNNGTFILNPGYAVSLTRIINGTGSVTKLGTSRCWLQGVSTYTGNTTNMAGYLDISADSGLGGSGGSGVFPVGSTGQLRARAISGTANFATSRNILLNGNGILSALNAADTVTHNGPISGIGSLTLGDPSGLGTVVLAGTNTYSGNTTVLYGTLALGANGYITNTPSITVASNAVFDVSARTTPFTLAVALSSQTLSNSAPGAIIKGTNNCSAGTVSLVYDGVNPAFIQTNGGMTLSSSTTFKVKNTGAALAVGNYLVISNASAGTVGLVAGTAPSAVTLSGSTTANTAPSLRIASAGLYMDVKNNQTVTFGSGTSLTKTYGNAPFADTATASSGLTVTYSSDNTAVATVDASGNVTIVGAGSCNIIANQSGNGTYNAAPQVSQALTVNKATSTISYGSTTTFLYNGAAQTPTITFSSLSSAAKTTNYYGVNPTVYGPTANAPTNAGSYALTNAVATDSNCLGLTNTVAFTISATNLTVTAQPNTKSYDGTTSATNKPTITAGGSQGSDVATLTEAYADATAGINKALIPSIAITNAGVNVLANYNVTYVTNFNGVIEATTSLVLTNSLGGTNHYGQTLIFTAVVQTNNVTAVNATTNVIFLLGSTPVWTNALVNGVAYYTNSSLPVGVTNFTAQYLGDTNYVGSSVTVTQTVLQTTPVLTVTCSNIVFGATLVNGLLTGSVATNSYDAAAVTGSFTFTTAGIVPTAGTTNVAVTFTPVDTTNYTTATTNVTVNVSKASTSVVLTSSAPTNGYHDPVTFTATLPTNASGSVTFLANGAALSTSNLVSGVATSLTITNLPRGTNVITAQYAGDGNYVGSTNTLNEIVTNHPPAATVLTVTRDAGIALAISLADVATNWTDVDGDPVYLTAVNMLTTNGINLTESNWVRVTNGSVVSIETNFWSYITYTNSPSQNDQISYSISDGQGGTNIGYINIVMSGVALTGTNSIASYNFTNGLPFTLTAYGVVGESYETQRSTNLTSWVPIATNTAATNGVISISDSFSDLGSNAPSPLFYRLRWVPKP